MRKKIHLYFRDAPAGFALVAAIAPGHKARYLDLGPLRDMFDLSLEMVDNDRNGGFKFLSRLPDPYWRRAMNDLFEDPQGEFFIDDNQYADIALHMVKYMSADLEYVSPTGYPDFVINVASQIISGFQRLSNTCRYG